MEKNQNLSICVAREICGNFLFKDIFQHLCQVFAGQEEPTLTIEPFIGAIDMVNLV